MKTSTVVILLVAACIVAALSVGLGIGIAYWTSTDTSGVEKAANDFLSKVGSGQLADAYNSTASTLRSGQTQAQFEASVRRSGLTEFASATWTTNKAGKELANLDGEVTTKSNKKIHVTMLLANEDKVWKVQSFTSSNSSSSGGGNGGGMAGFPPPAGPVPSQEDAVKLADQSLKDFAAGVEAKDLKEFIKTLSRFGKRNLNEDRLKDTYKDFFDKKIDISGLKSVTPVLSEEPKVDAGNQLVLKGEASIKPTSLKFVLNYFYENGKWKLFNMELKVE